MMVSPLGMNSSVWLIGSMGYVSSIIVVCGINMILDKADCCYNRQSSSTCDEKVFLVGYPPYLMFILAVHLLLLLMNKQLRANTQLNHDHHDAMPAPLHYLLSYIVPDAELPS